MSKKTSWWARFKCSIFGYKTEREASIVERYGVPISKEDITQLQAGKVVTKKLFADPDETPVLIKLKPKEK